MSRRLCEGQGRKYDQYSQYVTNTRSNKSAEPRTLSFVVVDLKTRRLASLIVFREIVNFSNTIFFRQHK